MPLLVVLCFTVLVAGIFIILFFTGSDWAAGAIHLAIGAAGIALLIVLATVVRSFAGMASRANPKRVRQFISAGVAFLLLVLLSLGGFTQQGAIHSLQAHSFEGQQQWQSAINEFQLAGERAPASVNIARVYNEWGEQLAGQQHFQASFVKFDTVLNAFGSPADQVNRAQTDEINAYIGWAKQAMDAKSYSDATQRYDELLQKSYCQASCQTKVGLLDATAYYDLAEFQLGAQNYTDAVTSFGTVLSRFPSSPEATKLHGDYAQALFGEGQAQLTSSCSSAITTYQQLASQFADTSQGQQAAAALKAPQPVKGHFAGVVPNSSSLVDIAALMKGLSRNMSSTDFYTLLASSPQVVINSDGSFTFKSVPQGTYDLAWGTNNTADGSQLYNSAFLPDNSVAYVAQVGPLCAFDFGDIQENIPVAP
jgi:tetratricopeptide (TPR) repeat protein